MATSNTPPALTQPDTARKLRWYNIALLAFTTVWSLNNVFNNYATEGITVIFSWILIMVLYFVPYSLIVGQLGATFKDSDGGVSSWVKALSTNKLAYFAAWTYWIVHIPYLSQKPQIIMIGFGWLFNGNGDFVTDTSSTVVQIITLVIFLAFLFLAMRGTNIISSLGSIAGICMFIMSLLFIILGVSAPFMRGIEVATQGMDQLSTYVPKFGFSYLTTLSMLIFAVGGAEKISPYINKTKNPTKEFPLGMIVLAIMVAISAVLGSFAMGILFDSNHIPADLMSNGAYSAFLSLGEYYGLGKALMFVYAAVNIITNAAALTISIDAPLRVLLDDADPTYVPKKLMKKNKRDIPVNGYKLTALLVSILIIIPGLGIKGLNNMYVWLINLNSIVMPMRYIWVFVAYILLIRQATKFHSDYVFIKNDKLALVVGTWCLLFTAFACLLGVVPKSAISSSDWWFQLILNIATPIIFILLGLILPRFAKKDLALEKH
ncbi:transporter [Enterococcus canis]|uniref:Transporter n=1 Tax=Enterococcus canis TaxID=214095 RepID=A0A1L8RIA1_9ENTE|nr:amino acid permease [Enterococcus canis]OJG19498.1 transporter [Enterococcus canis]